MAAFLDRLGARERGNQRPVFVLWDDPLKRRHLIAGIDDGGPLQESGKFLIGGVFVSCMRGKGLRTAARSNFEVVGGLGTQGRTRVRGRRQQVSHRSRLR